VKFIDKLLADIFGTSEVSVQGGRLGKSRKGGGSREEGMEGLKMRVETLEMKFTVELKTGKLKRRRGGQIFDPSAIRADIGFATRTVCCQGNLAMPVSAN
jgi:hypothetical protein